METKRRYCINCDNKHGCKSATPPCVDAMIQEGVAGVSGKQYLIKTGKVGQCGECEFFRSCWNIEDYNRLRT